MAKRVRKNDVDRISNLPDAILSHILSFLSTKQAVGTSILSTRWRYLFALVPNLDFSLDHHFSPKKPRSSAIKSFESFVDRVLFFQNTSSIEKFRLKCVKGVSSSRVCRWIPAALCRGVQHLDLTIFSPKFTLLGVLFTCRTLVTLKLETKIVFNVPNYVCFPNLKTLHLKSIECSNDNAVKRLFSSCTSLEDMVMEECYLANISNFNISHHLLKRLTIIRSESDSFTSNYWIVIDAPMLVYFKYKNYEASGYTLENLQSLVSADIDFVHLKENSITNNYHQADATLFFSGIRNVQSLILSSSTMKLLLGCEPVPVFPNMVQLKIYRPYYCSIRHYDNQEKGLTTILRGSPQLENLSFDQHVFSYAPEELLFYLFKLKTIELSEFEAGKDCIEKAKYFLKNARVVEKLTIRTRSLAEREKLKISEELLASPKKSKHCCILIV